MVTLTVHTSTGSENLDWRDDVQKLIQQALEAWCEGLDSPDWETDWYSIVDEDGRLRAVLVSVEASRADCKASVRVTRFEQVVKTSLYDTRYHLDSEGRYVRSEVVKVA